MARLCSQKHTDGFFLQATPQQIISSFMTLGALVGALATGFIGARLCRRYCLMAASVLLIAAIVIMVETTSFGALYFARLLCGLANGVLMNFAFVYLQECAPPHLRSLCFGLAAFWITFGTTLGMVSLNLYELNWLVNRHLTLIP
jgi:MFS family permease